MDDAFDRKAHCEALRALTRQELAKDHRLRVKALADFVSRHHNMAAAAATVLKLAATPEAAPVFDQFVDEIDKLLCDDLAKAIGYDPREPGGS